jgi:hypothetical protein
MCRVCKFKLNSYMYSLEGYHDFCAVVAKTAKNRSFIDVAELMKAAKICEAKEPGRHAATSGLTPSFLKIAF